MFDSGLFSSGADGARTRDLVTASQALSQLSYSPNAVRSYIGAPKTTVNPFPLLFAQSVRIHAEYAEPVAEMESRFLPDLTLVSRRRASRCEPE